MELLKFTDEVFISLMAVAIIYVVIKTIIISRREAKRYKKEPLSDLLELYLRFHNEYQNNSFYCGLCWSVVDMCDQGLFTWKERAFLESDFYLNRPAHTEAGEFWWPVSRSHSEVSRQYRIDFIQQQINRLKQERHGN